MNGKFIILFDYFLDKEIEKDIPYKVLPIDESTFVKKSSYINKKSDSEKNNDIIKGTGTYKN